MKKLFVILTAVAFMGLMAFHANAATYNKVMYGTEVIGTLADSAATGAPTNTESIMAYTKQLVNGYAVAKTDGAVLSGNDAIFTITGGPVRAKIVGLVTTIIGGAANGRLKLTTTSPAATVDLNAGAVAIDTDAVGTIYYNVGATSVFTPSSGLGFLLEDPVTVEETEMILTPGTVYFNSSAAQSGVIAWYITYTPLTPGAIVTAAP